MADLIGGYPAVCNPPSSPSGSLTAIPGRRRSLALSARGWSRRPDPAGRLGPIVIGDQLDETSQTAALVRGSTRRRRAARGPASSPPPLLITGASLPVLEVRPPSPSSSCGYVASRTEVAPAPLLVRLQLLPARANRSWPRFCTRVGVRCVALQLGPIPPCMQGVGGMPFVSPQRLVASTAKRTFAPSSSIAVAPKACTHGRSIENRRRSQATRVTPCELTGDYPLVSAAARHS